ncbi:hypothetical protein DICVIV_09425 [Dictyocaulus viviparus]|uniref:Uncharacterized protein n=1 Tax=Dictyocaulus viviparus TaxID=29172 RepID=A0A0D8XIT0_DICVI|nr:hypothetical protein DICVIV_09425 [Dictyocaulus viviparus]
MGNGLKSRPSFNSDIFVVYFAACVEILLAYLCYSWILMKDRGDLSPKNLFREQGSSEHKPLSDCYKAHLSAIRKKLMWRGPPPPLLSEKEAEQLLKLLRNECPFCETLEGSRPVDIPQYSTDEIKEEYMIAHVVQFHYNDPAAIRDGLLLCSSCETAEFLTLSNLRLHWPSCVTVSAYPFCRQLEQKYLSDSSTAVARIRGGTKRVVKRSFGCPFPLCKKKLRGIENLTKKVLQLLHVMRDHIPEENAVTWILNWAKRFESVMSCEPVFKFDVMKSLKASLEKGQARILCSCCGNVVQSSSIRLHCMFRIPPLAIRAREKLCADKTHIFLDAEGWESSLPNVSYRISLRS